MLGDQKDMLNGMLFAIARPPESIHYFGAIYHLYSLASSLKTE